MKVVSIIMLTFALLGAIDRIFNNKVGLGKEFEKGFNLLGQLVLSMLGMIIIAPVFADLLSPIFDFVYNAFGIEPSIIPASLFANDMGGAPLAIKVAKNAQLGTYNGMVVASMMGATVSFTIPLALGCLKKERHKELILGLLCGILTIPIGCLVAGLFCKIAFVLLILDLLPLIIFSGIIAFGLLRFPNACIKIFNFIAILIKIIITIGLALGITEVLLNFKPLKNANSAFYAMTICLNASVVMAGAFPLLFVISKVLRKPMNKLGSVLKVNNNATVGFISTLANNFSTFELMNDMDKKGAFINSAFAVSTSFILADHLAFTMAFMPSFLLPMIIGKLVAGLLAVLLALLIYKRVEKILFNDGV